MFQLTKGTAEPGRIHLTFPDGKTPAGRLLYADGHWRFEKPTECRGVPFTSRDSRKRECREAAEFDALAWAHEINHRLEFGF